LLLSDALRGLHPQPLWEHFSRLSAIPRQSRHEQAVTAYIAERARARGLETRCDTKGNALVIKPASTGHEGLARIALQGHLDMVCEKRPGGSHDFNTDPIRLLRAGDYIMAEQTTLGADNGIGIAAALAVMESDAIRHGPLEFLFTVDEETGLHGASALDPGMLRSRLLLNLDSEEHGALYIGCAGSRGAFVSLPISFEEVPPGTVPVMLSLSGLQGGHSGLDIDKPRGNAIRLIARVLWTLAQRHPIRVSRIVGGSKRNAIPRDASSLILVPERDQEDFQKSVEDLNALLWEECGPVAEPNIMLTLHPSPEESRARVVSTEDQGRLLSLLYALPTGVIGMSASLPGLVETSLNLAVISTESDRILIELNLRSSVETALDDLASRVSAFARLARASVEFTVGYPVWQPNPAAPLLKAVVGSYRALFGADPAIKAIHAGLECAVIRDRYPGMDMVSFGPTIEAAHSPDERVEIGSVDKFWRLLTAAIENIS
jgi:dipeptidase D